MSVVVVGVTGGIAAYKALDVVSSLVKKGIEVHVIMTKNACEFVSPLSFETLTHQRVSVDTFDRNFEYDVHHISLAKKADCFVIVPATANIIAKIANGLADDMLSTTFLACHCPKIICPAMNTGMLNNPITQKNIAQCKEYGMQFVNSISGYLACGDIGDGKLADPKEIVEAILVSIEEKKILQGKKVFVSAGATIEHIDPVRTISNPSTGKMGIAIAKVAARLGAEVTLAYQSSEFIPQTIKNQVRFISANDLSQIANNSFDEMDIVIMAAAVSDYTPSEVYQHKVKKSDDDLSIPLKRTEDILKGLGAKKKNQILVGFAMETDDLIENATKKLKAKNLDMIVVNSLKNPDGGFAKDTNVVTMITPKNTTEFGVMSKEEVAKELFFALVK